MPVTVDSIYIGDPAYSSDDCPSYRDDSDNSCLEIPIRIETDMSVSTSTSDTLNSGKLTNETDSLTCDSVTYEKNVFVSAEGAPIPFKEEEEMDTENIEEEC